MFCNTKLLLNYVLKNKSQCSHICFRIIGMVLEGCKYLKYNTSRIRIEEPTIWRFTSILACKNACHFKSCDHPTQKHCYIGCVLYPTNSCIPQAVQISQDRYLQTCVLHCLDSESFLVILSFSPESMGKFFLV